MNETYSVTAPSLSERLNRKEFEEMYVGSFYSSQQTASKIKQDYHQLTLAEYYQIKDMSTRIDRLDSRYLNQDSTISVQATMINDLQSKLNKQSEAIAILAAELDELKNNTLEPLEGFE